MQHLHTTDTCCWPSRSHLCVDVNIHGAFTCAVDAYIISDTTYLINTWRLWLELFTCTGEHIICVWFFSGLPGSFVIRQNKFMLLFALRFHAHISKCGRNKTFIGFPETLNSSADLPIECQHKAKIARICWPDAKFWLTKHTSEIVETRTDDFSVFHLFDASLMEGCWSTLTIFLFNCLLVQISANHTAATLHLNSVQRSGNREKQEVCGWKCCVEVRGQRRVVRLDWYYETTVTRITSRYNRVHIRASLTILERQKQQKTALASFALQNMSNGNMSHSQNVQYIAKSLHTRRRRFCGNSEYIKLQWKQAFSHLQVTWCYIRVSHGTSCTARHIKIRLKHGATSLDVK